MFKLYDKTNSLQYKRSRYVSGGETVSYPKKLGWWERDLSFMKREIDDIQYKITIREAGRPDLICYDVYKRQDLDWLILQYNNIVDPLEELYVGRIIELPSVRRAILDITS